MDDDLIALPVEQDNELEDVASCIRSEDQPAIRIFAEVVDHQRCSTAWSMSSSATSWRCAESWTSTLD